MTAEDAETIERAGYVPSGEGHVYCLVASPARGAECAVVLLGPLAEEKKSSLRPLVEISRALVRAGFSTLRVDFRGTGDASGVSRELSIGSMIEDALSAVRFARSELNATRVGVVGLRLGAAVAVLAAGRAGPRERPIGAVVLVEPVVSGEAYVRALSRRQAIRRMLTSGSGKSRKGKGGDGPLDLDGLALGRRFVRELGEVDLTRAAVELRAGARPATLVLQVGPRAQASREFTVLGEALGESARVEAVVAQPFWLQTDYVDPAPVTARTLEFLESTFGALHG